MSGSDMAHGALEFGLLGAFQVSRGGEALALGGRRQRAILAMLVCDAGHAVSVERLIDGVWGDPAPPGVVTSVQSYVFHLRRALEPDRRRGAAATVLITVPGGYRLVADRRSVDVTRFEELAGAGDAALDHGNPERAATLYGQALSLWRGDALADLADYEFAAPVRARLEEERASALESRVQATLDLGHHQAVVAETGTLIAEHPLREKLHAQRVLALYRSGRQSDALAAYRELRQVLDTELGIEPSPPLQELNSQVLRQDPALDWRPPAAQQTPGPVGPASREPVLALADSLTDTFADSRGDSHDSSPRRRLAAVGAAVAVLAGGAALPVAGAPPATAVALPNAVSELDASGKVLASIPVGTNPAALATSQGAIWVVNEGGDSVSRIDPSTPAVQQTIPVGRDPRALAVTGDDLWVADFTDGTVSRINIPAGKRVDTIDVGSGPAAIAAGPAGLWVANSEDNTIQRIDPRSGDPGDPIDVGEGPDGLAVDETSVWVANGRSASVMRIEAGSGDQMTPSIPVGSGPRGIIRVGEEVWVANELSQNITRITSTGHTQSFDVGDGPTALAVADGSVWVAEKYSGDLVAVDPSSGRQDRIEVRAPVHGVTVVDGHIWVSSGAFASASHLGGTLRIATAVMPGSIGSIDPARVYDPWSTTAVRNVYDGLLAYHHSGADPQVLVPDLATSVPEATDAETTYIFNLRPGIRYSTGDEVKASDLVRGVQRALMAEQGRPDFYAGIVGGRACSRHPESCDLRDGVVADDATGRVTFHLVAPDPAFLYKLTLFVVPTPSDVPLGETTALVPGTGPYRIASFVEDQTFVLDRNPYFQKWSAPAQPAGFPDSITWLKMAGAHAVADAVQQGRADLGQMNQGADDPTTVGPLIHALQLSAPTQVHSHSAQSTSFAVLNSSTPPFDSPLARQAFNYAVDRNEVVRRLGGPHRAAPTCQLLPPGIPSYEPYCPYSTGPADGGYRGPDLARARALVRASGTYGMKVLVVDIVDDPFGPLDGYYAHVLRTLGYDVTFRRLESSPRIVRWFDDPGSGIQVRSGWFGADYPLPSNFYELIDCATDDESYPFAYCNPDLDSRAAAAIARSRTKPAKALRAWTAVERELTDQAPLVAVSNGIDTWITSEQLGNYQTGAQNNAPLLSQLWVQ